jgi:hypothetical protein
MYLHAYEFSEKNDELLEFNPNKGIKYFLLHNKIY